MRTNIEAALDVTRDGERGQRGHGAAAQEQPAGVARVRQELFEPVHDLLFDVDRGVIATGAAGVHRRGEGVCENPHMIVGGELTQPKKRG